MKIIQATYTVTSEWDLSEICDYLGISLSQIKEYGVKWNNLVISYVDSNGEDHCYQVKPNRYCARKDSDWKTPCDVKSFNLEDDD